MTKPTSASRRMSSSRSPSATRSKTWNVSRAMLPGTFSPPAGGSMTLSSKPSLTPSSDPAGRRTQPHGATPCPEAGRADHRLADVGAAAPHRREADALRLPAAEPRLLRPVRVRADRHQLRLFGHRRACAVPIRASLSSGPASTPICSTAPLSWIRAPAARTISGAASSTRSGSPSSRSSRWSGCRS